jgi:hypothetical protein
MKKLLFTLICVAASSIYAVDAFFTFENDALSGSGDNDYTHGTGLEFVFDRGYHFKLGQNIYAPSDLTRKDHIVGDRPYCGMLYGGLGYEFFQDPESMWTHYAELDVGVIGPAARCKETQTIVHKLLNCRNPEGWDNQLHNEVVANAQWWTKYNWYLCDYAALVPRVGALAGTVQDALEVGCDLKVGWNIRNNKDVGNSIMFSAPTARKWYDDLTAYAFIGAGERYYLYNHILEGSLFGNKDRDLDVNIEPFVTELRAGVVVGYDRLYFSYYFVVRTDEFKNQKNAPDYGAMTIGWTW